MAINAAKNNEERGSNVNTHQDATSEDEFENSDVDTHQDEQEGFQNNNTPARNEEESGIPTRQDNSISFSIVFHC